MTANESFDRRLAAWLDGEARGRVPDHLAEVLLATRATRQRPGWSSLERWLPMATLVRERFIVPRPVLLLLVLAALAVAMAGVYLFVVGRPSAPPFGLAENGRIVYVDGDQIIATPVDKPRDSFVAGRVPGANGLVISPDGRFVAYAVPEHIAISAIADDGDRSGVAEITAPGMTLYGSPAWSPSGDRLTFVAADPRSDHVFIANADGSDVREIAAAMIPPKHVVGMIGFSPDGRWVAFAESPEPGEGRLVIVAPDDTQAQVLPASGINMGDGAGTAWSPDPATHRILYLTAAGSTRYYDMATSAEVTVAAGFWPSWSPTGDRISYWQNGTKVVATPVSGGGRSTPTEIFPSFSGDCQSHPELAGLALCGPVVWSPDGTRVIGTEITGNGLLSLRSNGSGVPVLFDLDTNVNPGEGGIVAWQPVYPK